MSFFFDTSHMDVIEEWLQLNPSATITIPVGNPLNRQGVIYICQPPGSAEREDQTELFALVRLIAAAPELLQALKEDLPAIPRTDAACHRGICPQDKCGYCQRVMRKHAAIAKAEGRS